MNSLGSSVEADPPLLWSVCCGAYHVGATLTNVAQKISDAMCTSCRECRAGSAEPNQCYYSVENSSKGISLSVPTTRGMRAELDQTAALLRGQLLSTRSARNKNSPQPESGHQVSWPRVAFPGVGV